LKLRDAINAGEIPGPRLLCAGQPVTSVKGHCHFWNGEADGLEEAREVIERQVEKGVDLIKIMATGGNLTKGSDPSLAQFDLQTTAAIVKEANDRGFAVAAHCHGTQGIDHAARARVNTIEHCSWLDSTGKRQGYEAGIAEVIAANDVWISPTINAGWKRFIDGKADMVPIAMENFRKMREAGVRLIASTDAGIPNVRHEDLARALPVFAHIAALTCVEVLRSATSDCAGAIGLGTITGKIEVGFDADLMFVDGNPLEDLEVLQRPAAVVARGAVVLDLN
ncbi:MAG: amidohydrolase family protein, partial [Gammaproteobacteria bacterium]|nr:amidohydrolase family protein [Gammaproteobacteria bacterium]